MSKDPQSKKEKKKALLAKNRRIQIIMQHMRGHANEAEHIREDGEMEKPRTPERKKEEEEQEIWSAKLQIMRNRLTGQKHMAKERWNRFSGTSDAGSRGR